MTTANSLSRHYDQFTAKERVRLTMAALARGDLAERKKLSETCPVKTCRITDVEYFGRMDTALAINLRVCADLRATAAYITALRFVRDDLLYLFFEMFAKRDSYKAFFAGSRMEFLRTRAVRDGVDVADMSQETRAALEEEWGNVWIGETEMNEAKKNMMEDTFETRKKLEIALDSWIEPKAQNLVNVFEASGRFSRDKLGLEPLEFIQVFGQREDTTAVRTLLALYERVKPNEHADEYEKGIYLFWRHKTGES